MNEDSHMRGDSTPVNDEGVYRNVYNIPPPRQENTVELSRYLNDFKIALNKKNYIRRKHYLEQDLERNILKAREMNSVNEREYQNVDADLQSDLRDLENLHIIESRLDHCRNAEQSNDSQPPQWFVSFLSDPNNIFYSLNRSMEQRMLTMEQRLMTMEQRLMTMEQRQNVRFDGIDRRLDGIDRRLDGVDRRLDGVDRRLDGVEVKLNKQEYQNRRLYNIQMRSQGRLVDVVPFLNGEEPDPDLPRICSVEDINGLTRAQCTRYLEGYGIRYGPNETIKLKERLRDAVGLESLGDNQFRFTGIV
ncbi:cell surface glycoprotein [Schizosaccharomyces octosporus yFS286]|uniref:Cell surface glycoprotein n=1 Tax=Schizosaccharomyces octosporus (strain yFS286) TaxID=483514 RepID=S9RC61_SCHOY|nr:cell surface glycoprotein [Schizosaccharomyces octosporus yFS286]EPX71704.1 cell surface glycoprotein [Schizosaccharomyces octosporus yFS286]